LKVEIKNHINKMDEINLIDVGCDQDEVVLYPDIALNVARLVSESRVDRGILLCGTGIGMSISANKVPGIRAAVCHDPYSAERSRKSNNAQILCMGARVIGVELAKCIVDIWLNCEFDGGHSISKVNRISEIERKFFLEKSGGRNE